VGTPLTVSATTLDGTPPAWPDGAALSAVPGSRSVLLSWPAATDASEPITYLVKRGTGVAVETTSTSQSFSGLQPDTAYEFEVRARDAAGNVGPALTASVRTEAGPTPVLTPPTCDGVEVARFPDVGPNYVHADNIGCAATLGLVLGWPDGDFRPLSPLTRAQLASILLRALDASGVTLTGEAGGFTDVAGSPHASAIRRLAAAGIVLGRSETVFDPNGLVTRGQVATMIDRASTELLVPYPEVDGSSFGDIAPPHADAIDRLAAAGILLGYDAATFGPNDPIVRGQAASVVMRWLEDQADRLD
jgi:hypothetical protein